MENQKYIPDLDEFDHVDDFIDDVPHSDELDEEDNDDFGCSHGGCMPGPEEFD